MKLKNLKLTGKFEWADHDAGTDLGLERKAAERAQSEAIEQMIELQDRMYAEDLRSLLLIFQAPDAGGKDGTIKHVTSGLNPQGCQVHSFKAPSREELDHDFMWRYARALPERGRVGIFNRSYYEEVLVVRVHPKLLNALDQRDESIWKHRFETINDFEKHLARNGTTVLKFFLNVSKDEQKKRFLSRIDQPDKNWKFAPEDLSERTFWKDYQQVYAECFRHTSTRHAPWYVIPADHKWVAHYCVSQIIASVMREMDPQYPKVSSDHKAWLQRARAQLLAERE